MSYGQKLRKCRESRQLTQRKLADELSVHPQYLSDIERGKRLPGLRLAIKLRDFFEGQLPVDAVEPAPTASATAEAA